MINLSIITVVRNDAGGLSKTLSSISSQNFLNFELIVIDGGSTDNTLRIIAENLNLINHWISESDEGTYHAMNKGIAMASGEWLLFLNAGDEFASSNSVAQSYLLAEIDTDIVYSDWFYRENGKLIRADLKKMNVRHQSVMYRKSLHEEFGFYVVNKQVTISDYIFFLSVAGRRWAYCLEPMSICDKSGASGKPNHFYQRIAVELIFGRRSRLVAIGILVAHPIYGFLKKIFFSNIQRKPIK